MGTSYDNRGTPWHVVTPGARRALARRGFSQHPFEPSQRSPTKRAAAEAGEGRGTFAPWGVGTGRSVGGPASAVDRSRRESVDRHPGRSSAASGPCDPNDCVSAKRGRWYNRNFRTVGRLDPRRPPTTGMRARQLLPGVWESPVAAVAHNDLRRGADFPSPTPFGREHTTPIVQTRGGASLLRTVSRLTASPRPSLARSGAPPVCRHALSAEGLGPAAGHPTEPIAALRHNHPSRSRETRRAFFHPHATPALGPAPRSPSPRHAGPSPPKV